jgi:hypothetical protein
LLKESAIKAIVSGKNQYPFAVGTKEFTNAVSSSLTKEGINLQ